MATQEWLSYPSDFRITFEEKEDSEPNILIGSAKDDPTYTKWAGSFVINKPSGEFYIVSDVKFKWTDIEDYPENSPVFDISDVEKKHADKIKTFLNDDNKLKVWSKEVTIRKNLKPILDAL